MRHQEGSTIVEFAMAVILFLTVLLGIMDLGRILFTWNSAAEATRWGARVSVVCDKGAARVLADMKTMLPSLTSANVQIDWYDGNGNVSTTCGSANCAGVAVSVSGLTIAPMSPFTFIGRSSLEIPAFSTYLPREIMGQDADSGAVCS